MKKQSFIQEPIITVRYNKQDRGLTRQEAITLAQKGLKYDSMSEMLNDIKYLGPNHKELNEMGDKQST